MGGHALRGTQEGRNEGEEISPPNIFIETNQIYILIEKEVSPNIEISKHVK
jgi:hypothetical protein